jgi:triosephosphate isomerase
MRKKIVAGNWKMNNNKSETSDFIQSLKKLTLSSRVRVIIAPAFTHLAQAEEMTRESSLEVVAQNMNAEKSGAFTGEISATMLQSIGIKSVILGHSERRAYYNESDLALKDKVAAALKNDMEIIFCFGEKLSDRKRDNHFDVVKSQLSSALFGLNAHSWSNLILAYEPVWAIGTGETATPEQAQEMHAYIRSIIAEKYDQSLANGVPILYGGSVKPNNAPAIFSQPDVDGGLIGGAALKVDDFYAIVQSA